MLVEVELLLELEQPLLELVVEHSIVGITLAK